MTLKQNERQLPMTLAAIVLGLLGLTLRRLQLTYAFDSSRLPISGHWLTIVLCAACVLGTISLALCVRRLTRREAFAANFPPCRICFGLSAVAAALLLLGSAGEVWSAMRTSYGTPTLMQLLPGFFGVLAAMCIFMAAAGKYKGARPMTALYLVPFFFVAVWLVLDFKNSWSSDPVILDYCFELFAMLSAMTALYHLAGFCFDRGRRARTAFWCLTGTVFCTISIADGGLANMLRFAGLAVWLLTNAWQLLGPDIPADNDTPEA